MRGYLFRLTGERLPDASEIRRLVLADPAPAQIAAAIRRELHSYAPAPADDEAEPDPARSALGYLALMATTPGWAASYCVDVDPERMSDLPAQLAALERELKVRDLPEAQPGAEANRLLFDCTPEQAVAIEEIASAAFGDSLLGFGPLRTTDSA